MTLVLPACTPVARTVHNCCCRMRVKKSLILYLRAPMRDDSESVSYPHIPRPLAHPVPGERKQAGRHDPGAAPPRRSSLPTNLVWYALAVPRRRTSLFPLAPGGRPSQGASRRSSGSSGPSGSCACTATDSPVSFFFLQARPGGSSLSAPSASAAPTSAVLIISCGGVPPLPPYLHYIFIFSVSNIARARFVSPFQVSISHMPPSRRFTYKLCWQVFLPWYLSLFR